MGETIQIRIPNIGDFSDVPIVEIFVKPGDRVAKEDPLLALESDKAVMEVPAVHAGTIVSIDVQLHDRVSEGDSIGAMEISQKVVKGVEKSPGLETRSAAPPRIEKVPAKQEVASGAVTPVQKGKLPHASPSVRIFARELGVKLSLVQGTGPKNRITKEDVQKFVKTRLSSSSMITQSSGAMAINVEEFKKYGEIETLPLTRIQKISGPRIQQSWQIIPHVTHFDEADIEDLENFRKKTNTQKKEKGAKLTLLAFAVKASVIALKEYREFNASILENGTEYILKKYYNIGFAVDTDQGLVVPVIKQADKKGLLEIGSELRELGEKARKGSLGMDEITGASFTISSLGSIGGTGFTPIIVPPQSAILGLSRGYMKPSFDAKTGTFVPRYTLPFSLSYDHRLIDGALAARFCAFLSEMLSDVRNLLL